MKQNLFLSTLLISSFACGDTYVDGANLSGSLTISNTDCAIISPLSNSSLSIFELGDIPSFNATGTHTLHVNTGSGYVPYISLVDEISATGLMSTDGSPSDAIVLNALNSEVRTVTNTPMPMTIDTGSVFSFKETLFFQTTLSFKHYAPGNITATASVLVECVEE